MCDIIEEVINVDITAIEGGTFSSQGIEFLATFLKNIDVLMSSHDDECGCEIKVAQLFWRLIGGQLYAGGGAGSMGWVLGASWGRMEKLFLAC